MKAPAFQLILTAIAAVCVASAIHAQNVGINATGAAPDASAMLDVVSTSRGMLVPRMTSVQRTAIATPATGLYVYDTTTNSFWFYNGTAWTEMASNNNWRLAGNTLAGTEFIGSINAQPVLFYSNNAERMRILSSGQIGVNNTAPPANQLFTVTATATERFAITATSSSNSAGNSAIVGESSAASSGNSTYGIIGRYSGTQNTAISSAGVMGVTSNNSAGVNYSTSFNRGVWGTLSNTAQYSFGVAGTTVGNSSVRTGGVLGQTNNGTATWACLAYYSVSTTTYGMYTSNTTNPTGSGTGRMASPTAALSVYPSERNQGIGAGISGGVMGSWIHGQVYGTVLSGNRFGVYVDGLTITNNAIVQFIPRSNGSTGRVATYAAAGVTRDVYCKGRGQLSAGMGVVQFDSSFAALTGNGEDVIVTVSPLGPVTGLYIEEIRPDGFTVRENGTQSSSVSFTWIAVATITDSGTDVSAEIRDASFDEYIRRVMLDDSFGEPAGSLWWDGQQVRFDTPPANQASTTPSPQ
ncbi:MAG: hypothetical protein MUC87_13225 [Bacteroidia bacterium]|jgi:hypothetical protein|nr:hypothetical protein [Bacteroidia bacterium]